MKAFSQDTGLPVSYKYLFPPLFPSGRQTGWPCGDLSRLSLLCLFRIIEKLNIKNSIIKPDGIEINDLAAIIILSWISAGREDGYSNLLKLIVPGYIIESVIPSILISFLYTYPSRVTCFPSISFSAIR